MLYKRYREDRTAGKGGWKQDDKNEWSFQEEKVRNGIWRSD